jgi:hypothetical protein
MRRHLLVFAASFLPMITFACSDTGDNLLKADPDGYTPIPLYEASPPPVFDGSSESGDALEEGGAEAGMDARADAHDGGMKEASGDGPSSEAAMDAPGDAPADGKHDGAGG